MNKLERIGVKKIKSKTQPKEYKTKQVDGSKLEKTEITKVKVNNESLQNVL